MRSFGAFVSAGSFVNNVWDLGENRDFPSQDLIPRVLWTSVTAAISGGLLLRSGGAGSLFNPIRGARALMAAYEPIVEVDEKLTGNAVEIRTLNILGGGSRRVIFASPRAINNKDLINLHKEVVRDAALDEGFIANLGTKLFGAPRPGTRLYSTMKELEKLTKLRNLILGKSNIIFGKTGDKVLVLPARLRGIEEAGDRIEEILGAIARRRQWVLDELEKNPLGGELPIASPDTPGGGNGGEGNGSGQGPAPVSLKDVIAMFDRQLAVENPGNKPATVLSKPGATPPIDFQNFLKDFRPNPNAPNGPKLPPHDRIVSKLAKFVERLGLVPSPTFDMDKYKDYYDAADPDLKAKLPKPGEFRPDDNTIIMIRLPGGIEAFVADFHAHPYDYSRRSPVGDPILLIKPSEDAIIGLLRALGKYAEVAIQLIPQFCGWGHYSHSNTLALSLKQMERLDEHGAKVLLKLYKIDPALAAKGHLFMTGLDFSAKGKQDPVARIKKLLLKFPGVFEGIGELTFDKEGVTDTPGQKCLRFQFE